MSIHKLIGKAVKHIAKEGNKKKKEPKVRDMDAKRPRPDGSRKKKFDKIERDATGGRERKEMKGRR